MDKLYKHECSACIFLGSFQDNDLYFCKQGNIPTVIARYGNNGSDYTSGMALAAYDPRLAKAKQLTNALLYRTIYKSAYRCEETDGFFEVAIEKMSDKEWDIEEEKQRENILSEFLLNLGASKLNDEQQNKLCEYLRNYDFNAIQGLFN